MKEEFKGRKAKADVKALPSGRAYEKLPELTLEDVKNTQEKWVEGRTYSYGILGDIENIDTEYLKTLGEVEILTLEDIFGY